MKKMHILRDVEKIILRMREAVNAKNDMQLADYLGVKSNSITSWRTRISIPYEYIDVISHNENISFEWILTGEYPQAVNEASEPYSHLNQRIQVVVKIMQEMDSAAQANIELTVKKEKLLQDLLMQQERVG